MATGSGTGTLLSISPASTTVDDVIARVQANWPSGYHSTILTSAKIIDFFNVAQKAIANRYNFSCMETEAYCNTADGIRTVTLPDAGGGGTWTESASGSVLRYKDELAVDLQDYNGIRIPLMRGYKAKLENSIRLLNTADKGIPRWYAIHGNKLWFYDLPDHAANNDTAFKVYLKYYGYMPSFTSTSESNAMLVDFDTVYEYMATALGYRVGLDWEAYASWQEQAIMELAVAVEADMARQHSMIEQGIEPVLGDSASEGHGDTDVHITTDYYM